MYILEAEDDDGSAVEQPELPLKWLANSTRWQGRAGTEPSRPHRYDMIDRRRRHQQASNDIFSNIISSMHAAIKQKPGQRDLPL
jgi:hypothetical protein